MIKSGSCAVPLRRPSPLDRDDHRPPRRAPHRSPHRGPLGAALPCACPIAAAGGPALCLRVAACADLLRSSRRLARLSAHSGVTNSSFKPDSRSTATLAASLLRSPPARARSQAAAARRGVMLHVTGKVDRAGSVVHVVCWRIETIDGKAAGIRRSSRDFTEAQGRPEASRWLVSLGPLARAGTRAVGSDARRQQASFWSWFPNFAALCAILSCAAESTKSSVKPFSPS